MQYIDYGEVLSHYHHYTSLDENLINAIVVQMDEIDYFENVEYIVQNGMDNSFSGFTQQKDAINFAIKNIDLMMDFLAEQADCFCIQVAELIADLEYVKPLNLTPYKVSRLLAENSKERHSLLKAITWYVVEQVSLDFMRWSREHGHYYNDYENFTFEV